jgi:hypothetical protein
MKTEAFVKQNISTTSPQERETVKIPRRLNPVYLKLARDAAVLVIPDLDPNGKYVTEDFCAPIWDHTDSEYEHKQLGLAISHLEATGQLPITRISNKSDHLAQYIIIPASGTTIDTITHFRRKH